MTAGLSPRPREGQQWGEPHAAERAMNVCRQCGACCASFRVAFYWAEAPALGLPDCYVEPLSPHLSSMAGTRGPALRCAALAGEIGRQVSCTVYAQRPSPCRELEPGDEKCNRARARHGLPPLAAASGAEESLS